MYEKRTISGVVTSISFDITIYKTHVARRPILRVGLLRRMGRSCQDEQVRPMAGTGSVLRKWDSLMDPWSHRYMPCYHGLATRPGEPWTRLGLSRSVFFWLKPGGVGSVRFPFLGCWGSIRVLEATWKPSTDPSGSCVAWRVLVHEVGETR